MQARSPRFAALLAVGALLLVSLGLHQRFLRGEALVGWDIFHQNAPWQESYPAWNPLLNDPIQWEHPRSALFVLEGGPRWNPYLGLGEQMGNFTWPSADYPPAVLLYSIFPLWVAKGIHSCLHVALAGVFMFLYLRWRGHGHEAALGGALAYELSTHLTMFLEFSWMGALAPWAALAIWGAEALGRRGSLRLALATGGVLGAALLGGIVQFVVFLFAIMPLVALSSARKAALPRTGALLLLTLVFGVLLGAAHLLPMIEEFRAGNRAPPEWANWFETTVKLGPRHLALLLFPDIFGNPVRGFDMLCEPGQVYSNYLEIRLHVGVVVLLLAAAGATSRRGRLPALLVLGSVLLAFPTFLAYPAFRWIPGLGSSAPTRVLWVAFLFLPLLVACGLDHLGRGTRTVPRLAGVLLAVVVVAFWQLRSPAGVPFLLPDVFDDRASLLVASYSNYLNPPSTLQRVHGGGRQALVLAPMVGSVLLALAAAGCGLLSTRGRSRQTRKGARSLLVGLLTWELLWAGVLFNPTTPPEKLFPLTSGLQHLTELCWEPDPSATSEGSAAPRGAPRVLQGRALLDRGVPVNALAALQIPVLSTYGNVVPIRLKTFMLRAGCPPGGRQRVHPSFLPSRLRDFLSVRGVVAAPGQAPTVSDGLVPSYRGSDCDVWSNPGALPLARLYSFEAISVRRPGEVLDLVNHPDFDPRRRVVLEAAEGSMLASDQRLAHVRPPDPSPDGPAGRSESQPVPSRRVPEPVVRGSIRTDPTPVRIERYEPELIVVSLSAPRGGLLVLAEGYTDGWTARANGEPVEVLPVSGLLRGVLLSAGFQGQVELSFRSPGARLGRWLTLLALVIGLLAVAARGRRRLLLLVKEKTGALISGGE